MNGYHIPVLLNEVIEALKIEPGKRYIDCTLGGGGHTRAIVQAGGMVLAIDQDDEAIEHFGGVENVTVRKGNFAHLKEIADGAGFNKVSGVLLDLGVSSHQLETDYRGFSFNKDAKLDMRMDPATQMVTAADLVNAGSERELANLFWKFGEERDSRKIAKTIVASRPVTSTNQLAEIILSISRKNKFDRTHPATRVFQALRIAVNDEMASLEAVLPQAVELLETGGKLAVISFHSLEDRIVKEFFKKNSNLQIENQKPTEATEKEIEENPRARSGKLRVATKR